MKKLVFGLLTVGVLSAAGAAYVVAGDKLLEIAKASDKAATPQAEEQKAETPVPAGVFAPEEFKGTAFEAISDNPNLSTFLSAVNKVELAEKLKGKELVTVFAPNNDAFTKLPEGFLDTLMNEGENGMLKNILSYHIVPGKILSIHLTQPETPVATLNERAVTLKKNADGFFVGNSMVVKSDIQTTNGVVHIIETIDLNPQAISAVPAMPPPTDTPATETAPAPAAAESAPAPAAPETPADTAPAEEKPAE